MKKVDRMLFRMIKQSKGQFAAVLMIIVVGIAIFTALTMASTNLETTKDNYYSDSHFADLWVQAQHIPSSMIPKLENMEGIAAAEGRISKDVPFITKDESKVNVRLMSTKGRLQQINGLTFTEGRQIRNAEKEALLYEPFAQARGIGVGDEIAVQISGTRYTLTVCGLVQSPEFIYLMESDQALMSKPESFGVVYLSETLAQQALAMTGAYNEVVFLYDKDENGAIRQGIVEADLIDHVEQRLEPYGLTRSTKAEDQLSNNIVTEEITQLKNACIALPILFLLVAALVLMMMLSRMVKRDRIKIGVLKAIGYSNWQVLSHYIKYSLIAGFCGGVLGILLGTAVAGYMTGIYVDFFSMPSYGMKFYYVFYLSALLISCGFCMVSGLLGAKGAMEIAPAESMQSEAPKVGKRILLERIPWLWKRLTFSRKMIVKNIFRNKKRSMFILLGVALTFGMMLFTLTMPQVVDHIMIKHFSEFQRMDYNVSFYQPVTAKAVKELSYELPDAYIEGKLEYPFELSNGNKEKVTQVVGISQDTQFFSLTDGKDRPVRVEAGGILLTENLARFLKVDKGDTVKVKNFLPGGSDVTLFVLGTVKQALGMNAYMELGDMGEKLFERNAISGVYLDSKDPDTVNILRKADMVSTVLSTEEMQQAYERFLGIIVLCIGCMVFLSGILGFCIVYNATIVSLGEREMEFSSLRVLGFSKEEIFRMILSENAWLALGGILLGIPIGYLMTGYSSVVFSTDIYTLHMDPTLLAGVYALALTAVFLLLSQSAAYHKINQLDFLQALKNRAA